MEGLVEDVPLHNPSLLTHNRVYSKVGATRILQSEPAVLNFGGFELGRVYSQTLRIRNVRASGTRFHIIPPSTPFFKATCPTKKGLLAPGMSEEIEVEFAPQQYRYYYDCVRVHCEEENLLVPIHAYPVANEAIFPTRIDFGKVAVGQEVTRTHKLECKIPVDFEFEIVETRPNPCFKVEPQRGVIPGRGSVGVELSFCPLGLTTEQAVLEVRVSEFNARPVVVTLTGSGWPGAARDAALGGTASASAHGSSSGAGGRPRPRRGGLTMEELDGTTTLKSAAKDLPVNPGGGRLRAGAGNGDAYTVYLDEQRRERGGRDCRETGPIRSKPPQPPAPLGETQVGGVYVPDTLLLAPAEVAYVLNQSPGRLRTKDVKGAIEARKAALAEQHAALDQVLAASGGEGGTHPLERPDIPADVKTALFKMQLAAAEEAQRKVTLGNAPHVGDALLTPEQVTAMQRQRAEQQRRHQLSEEARATKRLTVETEVSGCVYLPPQPAAASASGGGPQHPGADASASAAPPFAPEWRLIEGSDWAKRTRVLDKFMRAAWRVVTGLRLQKRLERIKGVLAHLGYDKQRLAEEAANPVLLVTEADRPGTAPTKYLKPEMVRVRPLPLYRDVLFQVHDPLEVSHYTDFDELAPFTAKVPLEYRILGYGPEDIPGLTPYLPPLLDQPLLLGAREEVAAASEAAVPSGLVPALSEYPPLPDACKNMPYITLELGNRYSEDRVFASPDPSYGMDDPGYAIQPQLYDIHESGRHEAPASGGVRSLRGGPCLSDAWLVRQDTWAVQLGEEVVPRLMAGPEQGDLPEDRPQDEDKPRVLPQVPTDEQLARYLPQTSRALVAARGEEGEAAASAPTAVSQQPSSSSGAPPAGGRFVLVRDRHGTALDAAKAAAHEAAIAALEGRLGEYNDLLTRPCHYALHL
ncbi:hypothetical protein HYH03_007202 [Edaphochlamys debaryana]|uniref:HYDIN/VesB/CFA65-like Ig-like domain-containing protein n=1 Tax=Edaphochlamys debaryana TaxID=47281 RepID=A0A835Y2F2_9CHLO|nr:hypothetical protein HYH03_007202 [Edaphochlamys debaryana]|eukprot:KAG2494686.1 hypothetical protein HYH03_007202 [Edaphochlamys debaryana]